MILKVSTKSTQIQLQAPWLVLRAGLRRNASGGAGVKPAVKAVAIAGFCGAKRG